MAFVLASNNAGKLREFEQLFSTLGLEVLPQAQFGVEDADETGLSFIENALIKARHASEKTHKPAMADDSGIVVPALNGAPGIYSARYSGQGDAANNEKLLRALDGVAGAGRNAFYVAVIALVKHPNDPMPIIAEGRWHGRIAEKPAGDGGFGYDPLFIPDGFDITAAEMTRDEKQALSHRAIALNALAPQLNDFL
ncbi:MAG: RdgB/HAM1 family non-canonical purine NTP pyrophosphatase [Proteobacteria bacterium]|nr:MAG: RdgB/HAM1 family non-canonical purine NTP pyrophosphatase [Pseudomonadota bacterium]